jgi:hypothetical protein
MRFTTIALPVAVHDFVARRLQPSVAWRRAVTRLQPSRYGRIIVLAAMIAGAVPSVSAEVIDRVLAVVGGQLITLTDVTAARDLRLVPPEAGPDPIRPVLTKLIDRELVLAEVERYAPPEPTAEAVDVEVRRVRARFDSADAYESALVQSGIDEKHLRETLRQDLRIRAYLEQRFSAASDRREAALEDWMNGLRRRGDVIDLYLPGR